jgi:flagellar P-ring protein precursor FlgI
MAADGEVYVVAQGTVATGGFSASGESGGSVTKANPTTAQISNGGIVEREIDFALNEMKNINISLRNPDFSTAKEIESAINEQLKGQYALATDPGTVSLIVPDFYSGNTMTLISDIEHLNITPDQIAKIVIDENSGTVVMGENVRIDTVAIAQGNLVIRVEEGNFVSQPGPLAPESADTVTVPNSQINIDDGSGAQMVVLPHQANLRDVVDGLNALGVGPRDLITILQTIKAAGALQAKIEVR